ncbi:MAG: beta-ureidopropionase [Candidatus Krumholzibacteria bacterium]|nr:beta-ureidopropionase [Candidatus Krumholzibacteria bacterium]MDH4337543.1 beta-ureidopropionase [Candidatus Krumholzibacteria bacterium]MDH5269930.1 beta-ureidopropionase [Candidatus Krumholzibacteria bacterium]MDH5626677.1 beta-ureidopropionase [Candidatus Krumholzibacteria bacterium]
MKIGFLQLRPQFGRVKENVRSAKSMLAGITDTTVVLPELFNTGYLFRNAEEVRKLSESAASGYTVSELKKIAVAQQLNLVFGMAEAKNRKVYNSSVLITAKGKIHTYQKAHLFDREKLFFQPGTRAFAPVAVDGGKLGMMVCFDWFYPEVTRILALGGAQVICHPSNLVLPWCQEAMKTRCIENRVFAVTANRIGTEKRGAHQLTFTGKSQIVNPMGEVLVSAGERSESLKIVEIDPAMALDKHVTPNNDLFKDRKPALYKPLLRKVV